MKLAFIVQRYGRDIPGGAETLARQIAERLSRRHQIDVLTTTARDYVTWKNEYPEGEEKLRGVRVVRFPVEGERNLEEFNRFSDWIYANPHSREDELRWLEMQGPVSPKLVEYLKNEHQRYDLLVFFTYLYYPTYYGIQVAPEKSVLLPTAHDEPPLKLDIYKEVFDNAGSFIFNTETEELLVLERFDVHRKMRETIGIGMELLDTPDTAAFRRRYRASNRFLLYAGRIDEGKGCGELLNFFELFREEHPELSNLQLLLIGKKNMSIPNSRDIRYLGFLDEEEKLAGMAAANAVVIPSRLESLSIVALEACSVGTPVIVHGGSRVLVEHCRKANAGLYYKSYEEFEGIVEVLLGDKNLARGMGRQGQQYIKENFGWDKFLAHYELALRSSARGRRPKLPERKAGGRSRDRGPQERDTRLAPERAEQEVREASEHTEALATQAAPVPTEVPEPTPMPPVEASSEPEEVQERQEAPEMPEQPEAREVEPPETERLEPELSEPEPPETERVEPELSEPEHLEPERPEPVAAFETQALPEQHDEPEPTEETTEPQETMEPQEAQETWQPEEAQEPEELQAPQEAQEEQEPQEFQEPEEPPEPRETQEPQETPEPSLPAPRQEVSESDELEESEEPEEEDSQRKDTPPT